MYDFSNTWPYDRIMGDYYFNECPFCHDSSVLLPLKQKAINQAKDGVKTLLVMPCCHEKITILNIDEDYVWADRPLRDGGA